MGVNALALNEYIIARKPQNNNPTLKVQPKDKSWPLNTIHVNVHAKCLSTRRGLAFLANMLMEKS